MSEAVCHGSHVHPGPDELSGGEVSQVVKAEVHAERPAQFGKPLRHPIRHQMMI